MLVSVISPRHGSGQTITAINISALLSECLGDRSVIVDLNKGRADLQRYLSPSRANKGMDNFTCLRRSGLLNHQTFETCVSKITGRMDIMSANLCSEISSQEAEALIGYISSVYKLATFDVGEEDSVLSQKVLQRSDSIIAVLPQNKTAIHCFIEEDTYRLYKDKLFIAVNSYMEKFEGTKMVLSREGMRKTFCQAGYPMGRLFFLEFDCNLKNECDGQSVLNFIFGQGDKNRLYYQSLLAMVEGILLSHGYASKKEAHPTNRKWSWWNSWKYTLHQRRERIMNE